MSDYLLYKPASAALPRSSEDEMRSMFMGTRFAQRVADTNVMSPITADRLSPEVMPVFVKDFPLYDLIQKVPSNGVSHTFEQQTAFSSTTTPHTLSETGTVSDDTNTYLRKTSNIAVFAERRGVTLKAQFAGAAAGGPSSDLAARELKGGLTTLARDIQAEIFSYQDSDSTSSTATAPNGIYDVNGFNGLRYICQQLAPPENSVQVDIRTTWTDQRVLMAVRSVASAIWDKGGQLDLIVSSTRGMQAVMSDQLALVRYIKSAERMALAPGLQVQAIETDQGLLPVLPVPGNQIGTWTDVGGATYVDMFLVWTEVLELPYLGAPEPTVIRVPIGTDGQLRELVIPFAMLGFANKAPIYTGRVSLRIS